MALKQGWLELRNRLRGGERQRGGRFKRILLLLAVLAVALPVGTLAGFRLAAALRETNRAVDLAPASGRFVVTKTGRIFMSSMIHRKERADRHAVAVLQRPMTLSNSTRDLGVWLQYFLSPRADKSALSADRKRYSGIAVPTALIWGDKDTVTPLDQGRDLHALIKGSALLVMADVGHIPQLEDPGPFNRQLSEALRKMIAK